MDIVPNGSTPTRPAVEGALTFLRTRVMADRNRKPVLVLATDGLPQGCAPGNTINAAAGQLMTASMAGADAVSTYVIGVFAQNELSQATLALNQLATAGGTGMPFVLTAGQDLGQRFIDALNAIRGKALGCEFQIPPPKMGVIDYKKVNVRVNIAGGAEDLIYVGSADKCDPNRGGWYYDSDPHDDPALARPPVRGHLQQGQGPDQRPGRAAVRLRDQGRLEPTPAGVPGRGL